MRPEDPFAQSPQRLASVLEVGRWPPGVQAWFSTRHGGASLAMHAGYNLGLNGGDDPVHARHNRAHFESHVGTQVAWLHQVHGAAVARAEAVMASGAQGQQVQADASLSRTPGVAAAVLVADCLPVLLARSDGLAVAAAHAGWRGLAAGVLENTVTALQHNNPAPASVLAWLGPCIGPRQFEVGDDVREAFGPASHFAFKAHRRKDGSPAWLCDLPALARHRLKAAGVASVEGGQWCTFEQASEFFSFRRDRTTGRMAAAIAITA